MKRPDRPVHFLRLGTRATMPQRFGTTCSRAAAFPESTEQPPQQQPPQRAGLLFTEPLMLFQEDSTGHVYAFEIHPQEGQSGFRPGRIIGSGATFEDDNLIWHPRRGFQGFP